MAKRKDINDALVEGQDLGVLVMNAEPVDVDALKTGWPWSRKGHHPGTLDSLAKMRTKDGDYVPRNCPDNVLKVLRDDPRWKGRVRLNELGDVIELHGVLPKAGREIRQLNEAEDVLLALEWIGDNYGIHSGVTTVKDALYAVACGNHYHPVEQYLNGLPPWDGAKRIEQLLTHVLKCPQDELHQIFIRRTMIGAVARIRRPGCKLDTAMILSGKEYAKKSWFFRALFAGESHSSFFSDSPIPIGDKDAFIQLRGVWGYEAAEMESMNKATAEAVKQFLSSAVDHFRVPYERSASRHPRRCVLVGTTNYEEFLVDTAGTRRFWPIPVPDGARIDIAWIYANRDQLWAEASQAFSDAERWWLEPDEEERRALLSRQFEAEHPWGPSIRVWAAKQVVEFNTSRCLKEAVELGIDKQGPAHSREAGKILRKAGYRQVTSREPGVYDKVWRRT